MNILMEDRRSIQLPLSGAAYLEPTFYTTDGPVLIASTDAAFAVHPANAGSQLSISFHIGQICVWILIIFDYFC